MKWTDKLHLITNSRQYELYIYLKDFEGEARYAKYTNFSIGGEQDNFKLKSLGAYFGNAGNGLNWNLNMQFSTPDADHDSHPEMNCALFHSSGWWFTNCGER